MTEAAANLADAGSDSVQPAMTLDDAANIDFLDPDEDNEEVEQEQQSESATDEAEEGQEADETLSEDSDTAEAEGEGAENESANPEPQDDVTVTLNGEKLPLSELKAGYMKEKDYRHKTTEVANKRRDLEALTANVTAAVNGIADFLARQIPEAPDPSLAMTNPGEFVQRKAMHDAAMEQITAILGQVKDVKAVENKLTEQQRSELLQTENAKLAEAFPATATDEGRKKFFDAAAKAARDLGYSDEEIQQVTDHRMFKLAHYAMLGLRAEQARAKATKKVQNVPPVAPQKRQNSANASQAAKSREAVKRLARSGSLEDALAVDWD